jgi:hypothetical protein
MTFVPAPFPSESSSTPELEWIKTHSWQIGSAHADLSRIPFPAATDLERRTFLLAERWARDIIALQMLERPGAFERAHDPYLSNDPVSLLRTTEALLYRLHAASKGVGYRYGTAWLERLGQCIPADDLSIFMLLHISDEATPEPVRLAWLLQTLTCLYRTALDGDSVQVERAFYTLKQASVKSENCQNLIGLGITIMISNKSISRDIRETISYMASEDLELHVLPSEAIMKKLCPRALPHWPLISTLGLGIAEAHQLVFSSNPGDPWPLPALNESPHD